MSAKAETLLNSITLTRDKKDIVITSKEVRDLYSTKEKEIIALREDNKKVSFVLKKPNTNNVTILKNCSSDEQAVNFLNCIWDLKDSDAITLEQLQKHLQQNSPPTPAPAQKAAPVAKPVQQQQIPTFPTTKQQTQQQQNSTNSRQNQPQTQQNYTNSRQNQQQTQYTNQNYNVKTSSNQYNSYQQNSRQENSYNRQQRQNYNGEASSNQYNSYQQNTRQENSYNRQQRQNYNDETASNQSKPQQQQSYSIAANSEQAQTKPNPPQPQRRVIKQQPPPAPPVKQAVKEEKPVSTKPYTISADGTLVINDEQFSKIFKDMISDYLGVGHSSKIRYDKLIIKEKSKN